MAIALSSISIGVTHTGQPGPWISVISLRQQFVQREADDRVRLPAADLHDVPRPGRAAADRVGQLPDLLRHCGIRRRISWCGVS